MTCSKVLYGGKYVSVLFYQTFNLCARYKFHNIPQVESEIPSASWLVSLAL